MKKFAVEAFFPGAIAHRAYHAVEVTATNIETAARRAVVELKKREGVKRHRLRELRLTIRQIDDSVSNVKALDSGEKGRRQAHDAHP